MGYFDQWSGVAGSAADHYGIPRPVFFGLIQTESSWNPNASPGTTSAFGFTQLTNAAAKQVGANKFDPTSNLYGGAQYLSSMPGSNWSEKLGHYFQGPHASLGSDAMSYANKVLSAAKNFMGGGSSGSGGSNPVGTAVSAGACAAGDILACASAAQGIGSFLGIGGSSGSGQDSCGINPICYLRQWMDSTEFFPRLALAILAFCLILGGLYLYKQSN